MVIVCTVIVIDMEDAIWTFELSDGKSSNKDDKDDKKDNKADVLGSILGTTTDEDETYDDVMSFFKND